MCDGHARSLGTEGADMPRDSISKTAQVNMQMLAELGVPEALHMRDALALEGNPLEVFSRLPLARLIPLCVSCISEILYQSANDLILEADNPTILDVACGYSPRVLLMAPRGYTYIGADLPDVTADLQERRSSIVPPDAEWLAGYTTADATDQERMETILGALREEVTVVTQGLLSYLSVDEKLQLAEGVRALLQRNGGCWIIPDTDPDSMLMDTFRAVLGKRATGVFEGVYRIVDKLVGRDRSKMGWQNAGEVADALRELGFAVRRVPLWREGLELRCMERVGAEAAERLRTTWAEKSSLVVSV